MKITKLIRVINNWPFFLILYGAILVLALIPYYTNGCLILGGEGNVILDFSLALKNAGFAWYPIYDAGRPTMSPSCTGFGILLLSLIENLTGSTSITNFTLVFSIYFFPFFAMYLLCKEIKAPPFISFIVSLFYVVNPFSLNYLANLNPPSVFPLSVMPLFLWIILKYYYSNFRLFFFFGVISAFFSIAYTNQPLLIIIHISILLLTFIASYYYNKKVIPLDMLKKYSILLISFIAFNFWWILNFLVVIPDAQKMYTRSFAEGWLHVTVSNCRPIIAKMFSLTVNIVKDPSRNFFGYWYSSIFAKLITLVPIFILVYFVLIVRNKKTRNLLNCLILGILLIVLFFVKGNASPFGFIYDLIFKHVPFFYIFKTPVEKFGILYVFILSVLMLFVMNSIKNQKYYNLIIYIFMVYLVFCSIPIITGNILPDYKMNDGRYASGKYKDKAEYKQFRKEINNDISEYRILSLPGSGNYQVCMINFDNKYYTGLDPLVMNINKPFISSYNAFNMSHLLFQNISSVTYKKLLGIYNIKKIMINEDLIPWFGFVESESLTDLRKIFSKFMTAKRWGKITLYDNQDYFIPRIYASSVLVKAGKFYYNEED